jgi:ABC-type nitrate/sulfonate/bicarbonate transport system substrate-binding protein
MHRRSLLVSAAATAVARIGTAHAAAPDKVRVGQPAATAFIFTFTKIGTARGIYAANGIEVETLVFGGGGPAHQGLAAGSVDFVFGAGSEMQLAAKGAPEIAVASIMKAPAQLALAVLEDSPIHSPKDLKGKAVGVTSTTSLTAWCTREMSRREGWGPEGIKIAPLGVTEAGIAALTAGTIDALTGVTDLLLDLEARKKGRIITLFSEFVPEFPAFVIFASKPLIAGNPDAVRRFLKASLETLAFMEANKEECLKMAAPIMQVPSDVASKAYDLQMPAFTNGRFTKASMEVLRRSMIEQGLLDKVPPDDVLYTERFLPAT